MHIKPMPIVSPFMDKIEYTSVEGRQNIIIEIYHVVLMLLKNNSFVIMFIGSKPMDQFKYSSDHRSCGLKEVKESVSTFIIQDSDINLSLKKNKTKIFEG